MADQVPDLLRGWKQIADVLGQREDNPRVDRRRGRLSGSPTRRKHPSWDGDCVSST
jgi:hypothetical protein